MTTSTISPAGPKWGKIAIETSSYCFYWMFFLMIAILSYPIWNLSHEMFLVDLPPFLPADIAADVGTKEFAVFMSVLLTAGASVIIAAFIGVLGGMTLGMAAALDFTVDKVMERYYPERYRIMMKCRAELRQMTLERRAIRLEKMEKRKQERRENREKIRK